MYHLLIREVILIDDASTMKHLDKLEEYFAKWPKVKIIRSKERIGLIK